jgi:hypothetical protein
MDSFKSLAAYFALVVLSSSIVAFWGWVVRKIYGERRPRVVAILVFLTIMIPGLIFVVLYNIERASSAGSH